MRRVGRLLGESWRVARASRASSAVVVAVTALTCLLVLATAGRSAATEADIIASIDSAGSRLIVVTTAVAEGGPDAAMVERAGQLPDLEWAFGVGPAVDVRNAAVTGGTAVAARAMYGDPPDDLRLESGRWPGVGEVVVTESSAAQLGLATAAGGLASTDGRQDWGVVGTFSAHGALSDLDRIALLGPEPAGTLGLLYAVAATPRTVAPVAGALLDISGVQDPTDVTITTSDELVALTNVVTGQLGAVSRQQAAGAMAAGLVFVAVTLYASIGARRRDFGRRRALGASRSSLVLLVVGQALWPAVLGTAVGTAGGLSAVSALIGTTPPLAFVGAVAILALLIAVVASVPAALVAAWRDPVRILRVP